MKKEAAKAMDVVRMMRELGMHPDTVTYNALLNACEKGGRNKDVLRIFYEEMPTRGLRPDIQSYTTVVNMHGKRGELELALRVFDEAVERGVNPELPAYTAVIKVRRASQCVAS
jgi:pentatricopeptide repeat protein